MLPKPTPRKNYLKISMKRQIAHQNLWSLRGIYLRQQRCIEPEPVFGQIKWNRGFKRFSLRGSPKVSCEFGLIAIAHNLKKMWAKLQIAKGLPNPPQIPPKSAQFLAETAKNALKTIFYLVNSPGAPHNTKLKLQLVNQ
jgi:hypothetical protein